MKFILKILLTAFVVIILASVLPGVIVNSYFTAIIVALVLGLMNVLVRPILVLFTLPVTILTLGLFLLVINAIIVLMADGLVSGFAVNGFWWALIFSVLLSICQSILFSLLKEEK